MCSPLHTRLYYNSGSNTRQSNHSSDRNCTSGLWLANLGQTTQKQFVMSNIWTQTLMNARNFYSRPAACFISTA